jgi:hypothetical protein
MNINRSNYESYFIDYIDGNLPDDLVDDLLDFLDRNPDLAGELNAVRSLTLEAQPGSFEGKEDLYKNENEVPDSFEMQAIAYLEGDLKEANKKQFLNEIADDPVKQQTLHVLQKTKLYPDLLIDYPNKKELLHSKNKAIYLWAMRVAAMLLVFFSVWALVPRKQNTGPVTRLAEQITNPQVNTGKDFISEKAGNTEPDIKKQTQQGKTEEKAQPAIDPPVKTEKKAVQPVVTKLKEPELTAMRASVPAEIHPIRAEITVEHAPPVRKLHLIQKTESAFKPNQTLTVDEYLAHKLIDAPKGESFTFNNLANAGLKAAENLTNDRLSVERTANGKLKQINFESRLIAFSIPVRKNH